MPALAPSRDLAALFSEAHEAHQKGALAKAEKVYRAVLDREPDHFDALHLLGFLLCQCGRPNEALSFLVAAVKRNSACAEAWSNHGLALHALRRFEEALASYDAALECDPGNPDLLNQRAVALLDLSRPREALDSLEHALARKPAFIEALGNRGNALIKLNRPLEAIDSYEAARAIGGDTAQILTNRGHALRRLDRPHDAIIDLDQAIAIAPQFPEAHFERSLAKLSLGEFGEGWQSYEWRWATGAFVPHRRDFKSPLWTGAQSLAGKTILLHAEQGLGDTIQFLRFVPLVAKLGSSVTLEIQPEFVSLLSRVDGADRVMARGDALPSFDLHCPLMSLPYALTTSIATIPAAIPYIDVPPHIIAAWSNRLPQGKPRLGVVWAGRPIHHNDVNRSIGLAPIAPLFDIPSLQFVSLQRDLGETDAALLNERGVLNLGAQLHDFADTAAVISLLDRVITVDTAVAHLAGALGKPVHILLPYAADFRWLREREDSPWYPTAKLLRQPGFGDWDSVVARLYAELVSTY
jgi:tetratricopeptide (TPR) repeat protein